MQPIVILGSGLAGYNVAKELRKLDKETPLTIISADSGFFYSKPMLSNALASKKAPSAIALNSPEQMATQLNATVRAKTRVTAINAAAHTVQIGEETLAYSKLVLARTVAFSCVAICSGELSAIADGALLEASALDNIGLE